MPVLDRSYGPDARNRVADLTNPGFDGALAALESFYHALNQRDLTVLSQVWSVDALTQLNNPVGGILRGGEAITNLYRRIFTGPVRVTVTFHDVVTYAGDDHALFAGRETGRYTVGEAPAVDLAIRTSRYFRFDTGT